jgi:hypothetical protein
MEAIYTEALPRNPPQSRNHARLASSHGATGDGLLPRSPRRHRTGTAWLPLPCCWNDMNAASMSYPRSRSGRRAGITSHGNTTDGKKHQGSHPPGLFRQSARPWRRLSPQPTPCGSSVTWWPPPVVVGGQDLRIGRRMGVDVEQSEQDTVQTGLPAPSARPAPPGTTPAAPAAPGTLVFLTQNVSIYYSSFKAVTDVSLPAYETCSRPPGSATRPRSSPC